MTHSKLQTKRLEAQMSQSQLAAAAGINGRMLQYYEQGANYNGEKSRINRKGR